MATQPTDLALSSSFNSHPRYHPNTALRTYRIAAETSAHTYLPGTPLKRLATGILELWEDGQEIYGFLWNRKVTTSTAGEVQATVMVDGHLYRADIPTEDADGTSLNTIAVAEFTGTYTSGGLDTACKSVELAKLGFHVDGLAGAV